jgi:hypothetical protein
MRDDTPVILSAITARSMQEHDVLSSLAGLFVEDLALAPQGRSDINITPNDAVLVGFILLVHGRWACEGIVKELQGATPDVSPASESILFESVSRLTCRTKGLHAGVVQSTHATNVPDLPGLRYPLA